MKNLLYILCLTLLTGCGSHYIVNNSGYVRPPKNYKFSYSQTKIIANFLIDTTAIYYLTNSNFYRNTDEYKNPDNYIRFYSDRHFKLQGVKEFPTLEDINDINKGIVGYYKMKDNAIKLQIYSDINAGSNQLEFGIIDEKGDLILLNENPRTTFCIGYSEKGIRRKIKKASFFNPKIYVRTKIDGMTYEKPNW